MCETINPTGFVIEAKVLAYIRTPVNRQASRARRRIPPISFRLGLFIMILYLSVSAARFNNGFKTCHGFGIASTLYHSCRQDHSLMETIRARIHTTRARRLDAIEKYLYTVLFIHMLSRLKEKGELIP